MAVTATVFVTGIRELSRATRRMEAGERKQVREAFKGVGRIVSTQAQINARAQGLVGKTGDLARKIVPRSSARGVFIVASAKHGPKKYNYPGRLEFDQKLGPKPFLYPAVDEKQDEAIKELEKVLDWLEREWLK